MKKYLLGFDIGTEGSKGIIMDLDGNKLAYDYQGHDTERPRPGWAEHNAEKVWWWEFIKVTRNLLALSGIDPKEIAGVCCSAVVPCMVPLDSEGKALRNAMLYGIDTRCTEEVKELTGTLGTDRIHDLCHAHLSVQHVGPKILWFKNHEPELFARAAKFHTASSYLTFKLTGRHVIGFDVADQYVPMFDYKNRRWMKDMCAACGITPNQLPEVSSPTAMAGGVTEEAHRETGLAAGTPVAVGTGDFAAELLSMGGGEGDTLMIYGSTQVLTALTKERVYDPSLFCIDYPLGDLCAIIGGTATSASLTKWFRNNFGREEMELEKQGGPNAYESLAQETEKIPLGSEGLVLLPYFAGERSPIWDENARGMLFGLTLEHTKAHIYKAIMEGTAYSMLHHLDIMNSMGINVKKTISAGGGSQSRQWTQIMSDVTGVEQVCLAKGIGSPAGDAFIAGLASGALEGDSFIKEKLKTGSRTVKPDLRKTEKYRKYYDIYRSLYTDTKDLMHKISNM